MYRPFYYLGIVWLTLFKQNNIFENSKSGIPVNRGSCFQEGRKMLHQALKTLEQGFREYNNHDGGGASDGDEGFSDYSGGSLY